MKHIGNLKKQAEDANNKEEEKDIIAEAGVELTDDDLDQVSGGGHFSPFNNPSI